MTCKREEEDGLKITVSGEKKNINRSQQKYDRAGNEARQGDRTETTAYQGPVVQSIVSVTSSLRRQLVKKKLISLAKTLQFFTVGKM